MYNQKERAKFLYFVWYLLKDWNDFVNKAIKADGNTGGFSFIGERQLCRDHLMFLQYNRMIKDFNLEKVTTNWGTEIYYDGSLKHIGETKEYDVLT